MAKICLVSCVSTKRSHPAPAKNLYTSPLFEGARFFAETRFTRWFILSAKYGLLEPSEFVDPYEQTLKTMPKVERQRWAEGVLAKLMPRLKDGDIIGFAAGNDYREFLLAPLRERGFRVEIPLEGLSIGMQLSWLNKLRTEQRRLAHLDEFYRLLAELEEGIGGRRSLKDCSGRMTWPERGVYFFFENTETRTSSVGVPRVVRVGTHTVSKGSKTTLWHRLRTHRGAVDLGGNHRGSIFRLHVGAAILQKNKGKIEVPTWGIGQSAPQPIRQSETALEQEVSNYIGSMALLWLAVGDQPSAWSDRSYVERNSIALLSGANGPIDLASPRWLGRYSPRDAIQRSALWNVNYVDDSYDPRFLEILARYVAVTVGRRPPPRRPLAPKNWLTTGNQKPRKQLLLFDTR